MSRPVTFDPRAHAARNRFRVRAVPVSFTVARPGVGLAYTVARYGVALYVAQAAAGFAVGLVYPWLVFFGVL